MADSDGEEEVIDPRVQVELDNLNGASEIINHLEILHAEATTKFRSMNDAAITELKRLRKVIGKAVDKARPYYEARKQSRQILLRTQEAARAYQHAMGLYEAAKETIALAEERLTIKAQHEIDSAWQEMINHAIIKGYDAEKMKSKTELEHRKLTSKLAASENEVWQLGKKFTSSINKARPYFEQRSNLEGALEEQKQTISDLSSSIQSAKQNYRSSLNNLELISEEIHQIRKQKRLLARLPPREPCVGAESDEILPVEQLEINLDTLDSVSVTSSQTDYSDVAHDESLTMQELRKTLERCHSNEPGSTSDDVGPFHSNETVETSCYDDSSRDCEGKRSENCTKPRHDEHTPEEDRNTNEFHPSNELKLLAEASEAAVSSTDSTIFLPKSPTAVCTKSRSGHVDVFSVENIILDD